VDHSGGWWAPGLLVIVLEVSGPGATNRCWPVTARATSVVIGDHFEGQFEGQTAECVRSVSMCRDKARSVL